MAVNVCFQEPASVFSAGFGWFGYGGELESCVMQSAACDQSNPSRGENQSCWFCFSGFIVFGMGEFLSPQG